MELAHGTRQVSQSAAEDFISSMPDDVITNILDRLPVKDAIRTDILCRYWRFKWTLLTKLTFDQKFFTENNFKGKELSKLLFHLKGPITEFSLLIDNKILDVEDVNHCVMNLSRKRNKTLTLCNMLHPRLKLANNLYSCMELKELSLFRVCFLHSPTFRGFPNLLSLRLSDVTFQGYTFGEFIALCPLLEILRISHHSDSSEVNLVDIAKLRNLRMLRLSWNLTSYMKHSITSSSLFQLTSLPNLQELALDFYEFMMLADDVAQKRVPKTFLFLRKLNIYRVFFLGDIQTSFVFDMICGSPNLQTLEIKASDDPDNPNTAVSYSLQLDSNPTRLPQLQNVVLSDIRGLKNEVCLIEFILACSPLLKKMVIKFRCQYYYNMSQYPSRLGFTNTLLNFHRASLEAEIDIC